MAALSNQADLWKKFKNGNQSAFSTLYHHHYASLYFYALKATGYPATAQECVQDLFVTLWNSRERLGDVLQVKPYLFKSLRGIIHRAASSQPNHTDLSSEARYALTFSPEDFLIQQEDDAYRQDTLTEVLNRLPARQREAVYLKYYEDLSYPQIAEILQINYQSAVNLIYQAFQQLKQQPALRQLITCLPVGKAHYQWYPLLLTAGALF